MKRIAVTAFLALSLVSNLSHAGTYGGQEKVFKIRAPEAGLSNAWVTVEGFSSAGNCTSKASGLVEMHIPGGERGDRQLSILLSAKAAGRDVFVNVDDSTGPKCRLRYVDLL